MAKFLLNIPKFFIFSRKHKNFRYGLVGTVTNVLVFAAVIFTCEIILILLGAGGVYIPFTSAAKTYLSSFFF